MPLTLSDLAARLDARIIAGNPALTIHGIASLAEADARQLAPFTDAKFSEQLKRTNAGAILVKEGADLSLAPKSAAVLASPDPEMATIAALGLIYPEVPERPGVDERAVIESDVQLGENVHIGPYAVVRSGSRIGAGTVILSHVVIGRNCTVGDDCRFYPHVTIYDGVKIGSRVMLHSGVVLGADGFGYKFRNGKHVKVPQIGIVEIADDVEIGASTCVDRGALGNTRVGQGTKIDNLVQIGHGVNIGRHCILCGQAALAGSAGMGDYAVLGGNVGVADHVFVGQGARAGAKSGIGKDVPPGTEVFGLPADERKTAFRQVAAMRRLPELLEKVRALEKRLNELGAAGQNSVQG